VHVNFRLEYDACRTELELLSAGHQFNLKQQEFQKYRDRYDKLKADVTVKLQLLDDNQVRIHWQCNYQI
jgi:hypothetical protein